MSVTDPIIIPIEGDPSDFVKDAGKVNAELDKMAGNVRKAGSATTQSMKPAAMSITDLRSAYMIAADAARVAGQIWKATGQEFVNYAEQVKNMSRALGASAEETSRVIQVADDVRISYDSLKVAMKEAQKDGIQPNIEGLAKLADQYKAIQSPTERTKFLLDKFGKSGLEMGKLMEKGGAGIREMSAAVKDGLVMTDKGIKASDDYQASLDNLNDTWDALTMTVGGKFVPVMDDALKIITANIEAALTFGDVLSGKIDLNDWAAGIINANNAYEDNAVVIDSSTASLEDNTGAIGDNKEAVKAAEDALKNYKDALEAVSQANLDMESMSRDIAKSQKQYAQDHADAAATLSKAISEGDSEGIAKAQKDIQELEATWHESANNMIYDMVLVGVSAGGLLDSEQRALDEYAVKAGIKTQADIDEANRRREIADSTIAGILQSEDVLAEQRKVDAETLRLQEATTAAQVVGSAGQEAAAMSNVTLAIDSATRSLMAMAAAAGTTASAVGGIRFGGTPLPTGTSKVVADPRRGRGAGVKYALGGEFMIPEGYGYEGFSLGGMATASGGETVTITPKGEAKSGAVYNIVVNNPKKETAENSIRKALKSLSFAGVAS